MKEAEAFLKTASELLYQKDERPEAHFDLFLFSEDIQVDFCD